MPVMPRNHPGSLEKPAKSRAFIRRAMLPALAALSLASVCALPLIAAQTHPSGRNGSQTGQSKVTAAVGTGSPVSTGGGTVGTPVGTGPGGTTGGTGGRAVTAAPFTVSTYRYDNFRSGSNPQETILKPPVAAGQQQDATKTYVAPGTFGKLFSRVVDGLMYAQPLYYQNLVITNPYNNTSSTHNVVFVATNNNSVYAFDADSNVGSNGGPLWRANFNVPGVNGFPTSGNDITTLLGLPQAEIQPLVGIVGTPVIDVPSKTLYVLARTTEGLNYVHRLHAIDITTGQEKFYSPQLVGQTEDNQGNVAPVIVPGNGDNFDGNGNVSFDLLFENQRPALTLVNGVVYVAYGSFDNAPPYHGWVFGFDAQTFTPQSVFCTSPNASNTFLLGDPVTTAGINMSGSGLAADETGLYFTTGNGIFNANGSDPNTGQQGTEYGESVLKLGFKPTRPAPSAAYLPQLPVVSYFAPFNHDFLSNNDIDLGRGGVALLSNSLLFNGSSALVTAGQEGKIYLLRRGDLGGVGGSADTGAIATLSNAVGPIYGPPAVYTDNTTSTPSTIVYYHGAGDVMRGFTVTNTPPYLTPTTAVGTLNYPYHGGIPVISSANGTDGLIWELEGAQAPFPDPKGPPDLENQPRYTVLHAYRQSDLKELTNSNQKGGGLNSIGDYVNFTQPLVAGGKVFVTAGAPSQFDPGGSSTLPQGRLVVFGKTTPQSQGGQGLHYMLSGPIGWAAISEGQNAGIANYSLPAGPWGAGLIKVGRLNYYSVTAVDANNQPQKITTTCQVTLREAGTTAGSAREIPLGTVSFNNQSNVVFSKTINVSGVFLMKVQDANGNASQNNPLWPPPIFQPISPFPLDQPLIDVVGPATTGFDHFSLRLPAAAREGQVSNISITAVASNNTPTFYPTLVAIYDTLPAGVQEFQLPADLDPGDGFGPNNLLEDPATPHVLAPTSSVHFAYEFQYGISDFAIVPGDSINISDQFLGFNQFGLPAPGDGIFGTDYPNIYGTGTYPCIFSGVGTHVVIVEDVLTGTMTTGTINVVAGPTTTPVGTQ